MDRRIGRPVCLASSNAPCDQGCQLISDARFGRGEKWNSAPASGMGEGSDGNVISTSAVDAYIEKNSRRFIGELKELCSFPSISNHGREAIQPARDWLAERLAKFTDRVETLEAGGGAAQAAALRALRRAARRPDRPVDHPAVRARGAGRPDLCAWRRRRQS